MMETYYAIAYYLGQFLEYVLAGAGLAFLSKSYIAEPKKRWLVFAAYVLLLVGWNYVPMETNGVIVHWLTAGMIFGQLLILGPSQRTRSDQVYFVITFETIRWVCSVAAVNLYLILSVQIEAVLAQSAKDPERLQWLWFGSFCLMKLLNVLLFGALFFLAVRLFDRLYLQKNQVLEPREAVSLLIPSFLGIVNHLIRYTYNQLPGAGGEPSVLICLLWVLNDVIFLAAMFLVLYLFQRQRQQEGGGMLLRQPKDIQLQVKAAEQMYDKVRGLRHDLENHALVLNGLLAESKYEEAEQYVHRFRAAADDLVYEIQSGNPVTDVILNEKKKEAQQLGIRFQCAFHYPRKSGLDVFDVSIVISNGLENALEAARQSEAPLVEIRSLRRKNIWVITIVNSTARAFETGRADGLPLTTKEMPGDHGFGLKNVRAVAEKYFGVMELSLSRSADGSRNLVTLTVMLQLP